MTDVQTLHTEPSAASLVVAFTAWFGVPAGAARVLAALYRSTDPLNVAQIGRCADVPMASIAKHHVPILRQVLDCEALDKGKDGYSLTESGRAECRAACWRIGEELQRAS